MEWTDLAKDRDMCWALCKHGNEPSGSKSAGNFLTC